MRKTEEVLRNWVEARADDARGWLAAALDALAAGAPERELHVFLGLAPRRLGKRDLDLGLEDLAVADAARPGWRPRGWSLDGAARVLALLVFRPERPFAAVFKDLRRTADAAEMIALYRGLPLYPVPEALEFEVGEGLRSNLKPVFEAIAHDNPFPCERFDEHRFNHMVLKALFVGSTLTPIMGLEERANPELARILVEYAEERAAAGRPVSPELWRPVRPFAGHPGVRGGYERARRAGRIPSEAA